MTLRSASPGRRKLPARFHAIVFPFILSVFMCGTVSAVSTAKAIGLAPDFAVRWLTAWGLSWLVAFPVLLLILPAVRRIVGWLVHAPAR